MGIRGFVAVFIFLLFAQTVIAQQTKLLILDKPGSRHRITYEVGDWIILKLRGEDFEIRDQISDIADSVLFLTDFFIPVNSIHYIKTVHTKGLLSPSNGPKLMIAGGALFVIDVLNQTLIRNSTYQFSKGVTIASASLVGFGGLLMTFKYRKFRPGKKRRIRTFIN
jgi:hypothetical protein